MKNGRERKEIEKAVRRKTNTLKGSKEQGSMMREERGRYIEEVGVRKWVG